MVGGFSKNCYTTKHDEVRIFLGSDRGQCYGTGDKAFC
jgi:hypothetical protein